MPGNHEFYHHDIALIDELKAQAPDHIHVLNDDQVVIDGVRFLGSILWTDFALFGEADRFFAMQQARQQMTDFSIIENNGQRFTPEDAIRLHTASGSGWRPCWRNPSTARRWWSPTMPLVTVGASTLCQ